MLIKMKSQLRWAIENEDGELDVLMSFHRRKAARSILRFSKRNFPEMKARRVVQVKVEVL